MKIEIEIDLTRNADTNLGESTFHEMNGWHLSAMQMCPEHKIAIAFLHAESDIDPLAAPCMLVTLENFRYEFRSQIANAIDSVLKKKGAGDAKGGEAPLDSDT